MKHTPNLFVNELKLFVTNFVVHMKELDIVTTFSEDIGTKIEEDEFA